MSIEAQLEAERAALQQAWVDTLPAQMRKAYHNAFMGVYEQVVAEDKVRQNVNSVLEFLLAEEDEELGDPKLDLDPQQAQRRDDFSRGKLAGIRLALIHLIDPEKVRSAVERLRFVDPNQHTKD